MKKTPLLALPVFYQGLEPGPPAKAEELALDGVVVGESVFAPDGVEDPVADVDQVQKIAEFLVGQIDLHGKSLLKRV